MLNLSFSADQTPSGGVMMTSDHLEELSPDRLKLWRLLLTEERAICEFPLLGRSDIFYERLASVQSHGARYLPRAEDPILVQVRPPTCEEALGAVFFLNMSNRMVQRSYSLIDLGIKESVYLCNWQDRSSSEQAMSKIAVTWPGHHSALFFFSRETMRQYRLACHHSKLNDSEPAAQVKVYRRVYHIQGNSWRAAS